jgi:transglutaminase-like putative cysteine protease
VLVSERAALLPALGWVLLALGVATLPHVPHLPVWVTALLLAAGAWRWLAQTQRWPLAPRWLRTVVVAAATLAVLFTYQTVNGVQAGTALLVLMAALKLLETRAPRDLSVLVFIAWFLAYASFLRNQTLSQLPLLMASALLTTAALIRVHSGRSVPQPRELARGSGQLLLQAVPLALVLFLLFPRLPGPFWGLETSSSARTGLDDEMSPGDVSELTLSDEVAFRVRFAATPPPPQQRYWRGPVLGETDGRRWRHARGSAYPPQPVQGLGAPVDYQITLEPHSRRWVFALDMPAQWESTAATLAYDYTLLAGKPVTEVTAWQLQSYPRYVAGAELPPSLRTAMLALPAAANPRAVALGRELATRNADPLAAVRAMLRMFREQPFEYTLQPPKVGSNPTDEFLFTTRQGFCEHYAAAFTVVMRAAGVPARVVTGYQGGEYNPYGGYFIVRQSDAHAWSEIWLAGRGWVRVDPTAAVAPERVNRGLVRALPADESAPGRLRESNRLWGSVTLGWDLINDFWNERVVRFDTRAQLQLLERLGVRNPDWRALGYALAACFAAFFLALTAWLAWQNRPPRLDPAARWHGKVLRRLRSRGIERQPGEGPIAVLERAAETAPDLAEELLEIRDLYAALRYGPASDGATATRLRMRVRGLRP